MELKVNWGYIMKGFNSSQENLYRGKYYEIDDFGEWLTLSAFLLKVWSSDHQPYEHRLGAP